MTLFTENNERIEPLGGGLEIIVSDDHIFGTDAVLLSDFAAVKSKETACDLGTGCGIIPLLWCKKQTGHITAVDIQKKACSQLERSLERNSLKDRITVINGDLRELRGRLTPARSTL